MKTNIDKKKIIGEHFPLGKIKEKVTVFEDNKKVADTN